MRHDEFHDRLQDACRWEAYIQQPASQNSEPFYISAKVTFEWGSHKRGEGKRARKGLLTELIGRKQRYPKTQLRWTRVDLRLHASFTAVTVDHSWQYLDDWRDSGIEPWSLVRFLLPMGSCFPRARSTRSLIIHAKQDYRRVLK